MHTHNELSEICISYFEIRVLYAERVLVENYFVSISACSTFILSYFAPYQQSFTL